MSCGKKLYQNMRQANNFPISSVKARDRLFGTQTEKTAEKFLENTQKLRPTKKN
jgi:hypothetical protein